MKHEFKIKVYHADTDAYRVVWHGAYLRWLERGRIETLEKYGIEFKELDKMGIIMPLAELDIKYRTFGRVYDELSVESYIESFNKASIVFHQEIKNINTGQTVLTARAKGVTTSKEGVLFRTIPDYLREKYNQVQVN